MKKLIFSISAIVLVAVLDSTLSLGLPVQCYVVPGFFVMASVLELHRLMARAEKKEKVKGQTTFRMAA